MVPQRYRVLFAAVLVCVVAVAGFVALHRSTTEPILALDWESGDNTQFSNLECAHPATQFAVVRSPVRQGNYAARFSETAADSWVNGNVRCLDARYDTGETTGDDFYFGFSIYVPAGGLTQNIVWELHHPRELYSIDGCGLAPVAILVDARRIAFRTVGGNCTVGSGYEHSDPDIPLPNLDPYPRDHWLDFVVHIRFREAPTGLVEVWARPAGAPWSSKPDISRQGIPTMPFCAERGVYNTELYTELGLYPGIVGYKGNDTIYIDGYRRGSSFDAVAPPDTAG
jgi:Polysaccharide lyase